MNSIVTTVPRKTAHRRISFLIVAVSAPERHWIGFLSHFARAAHATYSVGTVRSSGRTHILYIIGERSEPLSRVFIASYPGPNTRAVRAEREITSRSRMRRILLESW